MTVLDVRSVERMERRTPAGATHIPLGYLADRIDETRASRPIVVHCQSGGRSSIAASILERAGFRDVANLTGGTERGRRRNAGEKAE